MRPDNADDAGSIVSARPLESIAATLRMDAGGAQLLRAHGARIYLLPREPAVVRIIEATDENRTRASISVTVTAWLIEKGFPAVEPLHPSPVDGDGFIATVWGYLPQPDRTDSLPLAVLGHLLRDLHSLPTPPFPLPVAHPLGRLRRAIAIDTERGLPVLPADQRGWLIERMGLVNAAYETLAFPLGHGLIHNDAHVGNLLVGRREPPGYVLADWESTCWGPREIDLVQEGAPGNRFGLTEDQRRKFSDAYGYDIASWPGWAILRELRDLHSLAGHLRVAPDKHASRTELQHRLRTLQTNEQDRWHGVA